MREQLNAPRVYVLLLKQDDPRKCSAAKLAKFRLATPIYRVRQIPRSALLLNPLSPLTLLPKDRVLAENFGVVAVDCSWERVEKAFSRYVPGEARKLPTLLASNPVNYARANRLSSVEALAAALYILGFKGRAGKLLSLFKWGSSFLTLNSQPLESYSSATTRAAMLDAEAQFF